MRISVEIDENRLKKVMRYTGCRKKSSALSVAIAEYLRIRRVDDLIEKVSSGLVSFGMTNSALESITQ